MATSFSEILPVITGFILIMVLGVAGLVVSQKLLQCTEDAKEKLKGKNIDISNGGVRLGVKDVSKEEEMDRLERLVGLLFTHSLPQIELLFLLGPS